MDVRFYLFLMCAGFGLKLSGQTENISISYEQKEKKIVFYARNTNLVPVSIKMDFDLTNMKITTKNKEFFIIPPLSKKYKITSLSPKRANSSYNFQYNFTTQIGKTRRSKPDKNFVYNLPYSSGSGFKIDQGYNGSFSHQDKKALDFGMSIGQEIRAARAGIVTKVIDKNKRHCPKRSCIKFNNKIVIYHDDGTFARYVHLKQNSAKVEVGQKVKADDLLASSGQTGFTDGPHLHFEVIIPMFKVENTLFLPTHFKTKTSKNPLLLKEGKSYLKP
jgi:murein DD-endopeptidase MepM/ murein hydrolase activator NlpD